MLFQPFNDVTGVILAGGASSRMGRNKALLEVNGVPLIEKVYRTLARLFWNVLIITNTPEEYAFLSCRKVADIYPGLGPIAGLHAGLMASSDKWIFMTACDAPYINPAVIRMVCSYVGEYDAVVPISKGGKEPIHALYKKSCLVAVEQACKQGDLKLLDLLDQVRTRFITSEEMSITGHADASFCNVNTPEEYANIVIAPSIGNY